MFAALSRTSMLGGLRQAECSSFARQRLGGALPCSRLLASHALRPRHLAYRHSVAVHARLGAGEALSRASSSDLVSPGCQACLGVSICLGWTESHVQPA
jgi:hypothetical protein